MEINVINTQGQVTATLAASDTLFKREYNEALVHQLVKAYLANARSGNRAQKGRSDVAKSTRRLWAQKGTGRARNGMASSPIWRGGGKIFPNSPDENFSQKVNRKAFRAGMASILSNLVAHDRLVVVDGLELTSPKTKELVSQLKDIVAKRILIVVDELDDNLYLASRNLEKVLVLEAQQADPVSLVNFDKVLVTRAAVAKFEELWA